MATTPGRSRKLRYRFAASASLVLALLAGLIGFAPSAFAHHPIVVGTSTCQDDGRYSVNWTVSNSESPPERFMLVRSFSVTPSSGTTTGLVANGTYSGVVSAGNPAGATVVAPSGAVPAITADIPAGVTSITLAVTGYWHYPTGDGNFNTVTQEAQATVDLSKVCHGSLKIKKLVTGETAPLDATYTVTYANGKGVAGQVQIKGGETRTVTGLPYGSYTLAETGNPANDTATITPNPAIVDADTPQATVDVTNAFPDQGGFSVTKHVTGQTTGYVDGSTFTVSYSCSDGTSGSVTLAKDETRAVGGLPLGTTCTLAETAKPATADLSYAYSAEAWTPSNVVTVTAKDQVAAVTLTNPIRRLLGGFSVTKHVTGETGGYVPGSKFTVTYDCGGGFTGALQIIDGETQGVGSIPVGTVCILSEAATPATKDASYAYGTETWDPSNTVTITDEDHVVAVVLDNPITRVVGSFTVTKKVTGETAGYVPGSTFVVTYTCTNGAAGSLTIADGQTAGASGLPVGTSCTLAETVKPATTGSAYTWGTETWSPSNTVIIAANDSSNTTALTLDNPLQVTAAVAVLGETASLPRTGASDTGLLLTVAGLLILAGGCFVVASRIED